MAQIILSKEEKALLTAARRRWAAMVAIHAKLKESGFTVRDIVGLQNPHSYIVSKSVDVPMQGEPL